MNNKGYVLIEVLVAAMLLSFIGAAICIGIVIGSKVRKTAVETQQIYAPFMVFSKKIEKDLHNAVAVRSEIFSGKRDEVLFPVKNVEWNVAAGPIPQLKQVRYFLTGGALWRAEKDISHNFIKQKAIKRQVLAEVEKFQLEYAYLDEEDNLRYQSFWIEEPYLGIPKAIKLSITRRGVTLTKLIAIAQGKWGRLQTS